LSPSFAQQEADELVATKKWRDRHKIWTEYKGKPRKEAVANFRLKTGHDCLAASLTLRRLMSYIYGAPILDVSRSHTTTQHSR